ncbi:MAG: translation elongation factor Ts [Clostridiales bacterium]|jgi:elongation factor Ts|nr:translation elongation factor Ts [Clostridiales bacterium]
MTVTAQMVKELRETTGAGMSACKDALVAADGDREKAIEYLREKGLAAAQKKSSRIASEGLVYAYISEDNSAGAIVEVNSETDFVAKNQEFRGFVEQVARHAVKTGARNIDALLAEQWSSEGGGTIRDALTRKVAVIGENLNIRRFTRFVKGEGVLVSYIHGGGRVAVLLELASDKDSEAVKEAGKNICMQIAAMSPLFVKREDIPPEFIDKEREILHAQALNEEAEKPEHKRKAPEIINRMVGGRLEKELKSFCLVDQEYVKDSELTVGKYLDAVGKEQGCAIAVKRFERFETGEGLEKKEENFAEEVSKVMNAQKA